MASVLIVDDNTALAENLREVLLSVGVCASVEIAEDAARARSIFPRFPHDVAIVDIQLPDASGLELVAELKAMAPRSEFVVLTGQATVETAILAMRAGASGLILKSGSPGELVATVEQALAKSLLRREREKFERRYLALVHAADVLVVGLDAAGTIDFVNTKLAELLGISVDAAPGASLSPFVDPDDWKRFSSRLADVVRGDASRDFEVGIHVSGRVRRVRWHFSAVEEAAEGESSLRVYGMGVDVTERRELERRAASAEALNAMAPLALGLAHEIRNPLNAAVLELHLLGRAVDRLTEEEAKAPMRRRVAVVDGEIRRLERLLTEFLELARPRPPRKDKIDLAVVVDEVLDLEGEATTRANVEVTRTCDTGTHVVGDVEKLKQVVLNLVVNALEVMPEGGTLSARVTRVGDEIVFSLTDSGPGVPTKDLAEVFDPFFTTKPAGTGLGLAIVRKIVEQHGGKVSLLPAASRGTTAEVRLPADLGGPSSDSRHPPSSGPT